MSTMIAEHKQQNIEAQEMGTRPAISCEFTLGEWRVLPQLNRIRLNGADEERQLEPRLVKLLCFLAANEERVLSREELVQELWPRVVVNENSLTRAISELRKQLQSKDSNPANYIETIPKRGYRLLPRVELGEAPAGAIAQSNSWSTLALFTIPTMQSRAAAFAACLSLLVAGWVSLESADIFDRGYDTMDNSAVLSDELLDTKPDYLGGQLQLSTIENSPAVVESIATPVVSLDEKQYAFIQYDSNGSTIFLGGFGTAIEPAPVYFSNQHLFNLAWSPVGNNLLFAKKPSMTTAAVYSSAGDMAELLTLNLNTLEISRLVEDVNPADVDTPNSLNLT